jgi:hypothetical protein
VATLSELAKEARRSRHGGAWGALEHVVGLIPAKQRALVVLALAAMACATWIATR